MSFDLADVFLVATTEQLLSIFVAGLVVGYGFAARMSAHLSVWAFGFRTAVIGLVFLAAMMLSRFLSGSERYEVWVGIGIAFALYTVALVAGIFIYDYRFKKAIEGELGRPIRGNPRGLIKRGSIDRRIAIRGGSDAEVE